MCAVACVCVCVCVDELGFPIWFYPKQFIFISNSLDFDLHVKFGKRVSSITAPVEWGHKMNIALVTKRATMAYLCEIGNFICFRYLRVPLVVYPVPIDDRASKTHHHHLESVQ